MPIDFEAKTDRELLLLVAQQTNALTDESLPRIEKQLSEMNKTLGGHEQRITALEGSNPGHETGTNWRRPLSVAAGIGAFVAGAIYGVGKLVGLW